MFTVIKGVVSLLLFLLLCGCAKMQIALLYSNTVAPYSEEFAATPTGSKRCVINTHEIKDPLSGYSLTAEWSTSKILEQAHQAGIKKIDYIDLKTISILNGVYRRESLIVYGD